MGRSITESAERRVHASGTRSLGYQDDSAFGGENDVIENLEESWDDEHMDLSAMYGAYCKRSGINPLKVSLIELEDADGHKVYRFGLADKKGTLVFFREPTRLELAMEGGRRILEESWRDLLWIGFLLIAWGMWVW